MVGPSRLCFRNIRWSNIPLFNSNARIVSQFKAMNIRIVKTQKWQILLFIVGMILVLMMEVVD